MLENVIILNKINGNTLAFFQVHEIVIIRLAAHGKVKFKHRPIQLNRCSKLLRVFAKFTTTLQSTSMSSARTDWCFLLSKWLSTKRTAFFIIQLTCSKSSFWSHQKYMSGHRSPKLILTTDYKFRLFMNKNQKHGKQSFRWLMRFNYCKICF